MFPVGISVKFQSYQLIFTQNSVQFSMILQQDILMSLWKKYTSSFLDK